MLDNDVESWYVYVMLWYVSLSLIKMYMYVS